jgi:prephenate dehydrogenase
VPPPEPVGNSDSVLPCMSPTDLGEWASQRTSASDERSPVTTAFGRAAVLGLGLIGGSLLHAIRHTGLDVVGYDVDAQTAAAASAAGFPVAASDAGAAHGADLVVLAMPLPQVPDALRSLAPHLAPGAILTDVGTLKLPVLDAVHEIIPGARFVGGHPLAGTENSGWAAADPLLFRDAPWALTLEPTTDLEAWLSLADLACDLGAKPVPAVAAEQDAAVARVIGLPHVLAEALALTGLMGGPLGLSLAAGSYMSGSRIARTRPDLVASWCDRNPALITALDDVISRLSDARDHLADDGSMLDLATAGHEARIDWEHRAFEPVELNADPEALRRHGQAGGWITAVLRDDDGVRLLGMRPIA